jgi:ATP-dependent Clp protease ATP-binding subunit ClpC
MFERFTERARRVVVQAQVEARELQHNYIGTEHLLLGLTQMDESLAVHVLRSLDVDPQVVAEEVRDRVGHGKAVPRAEHIPFTPAAKKTLELGLREALLLKHDYIGTEHLLLAILHQGEGPAAEVLVANGVDLDTARARVEELLGERTPAAAASVRITRPTRLEVSAPASEVLFLLRSISRRLTAIENKLGIETSATEKKLRQLDAAIAKARREKMAAIDAEDMDAAARYSEEHRRLAGLRRETELFLLEEGAEDSDAE